MRPAALFVISVCAMSGLPGVLPAQESADSIAAGQAVRRFHQALAMADSATVLALLADDAVILETGGVETRAEYRSHHLPADIRFATQVPSRIVTLQVTLAGDVAWVTSASEATGEFEGRPVRSTGAELTVLTRTADGWRIRAVHWSSRRRAGP